jgi:hypothetical protein
VLHLCHTGRPNLNPKTLKPPMMPPSSCYLCVTLLQCSSPLVLPLCHATSMFLTPCVTFVSRCCNVPHPLCYVCVTLLQCSSPLELTSNT